MFDNDQNVDKLTIKCRQTTQRVPTNADNDVAGADKVSINDEMTENKNRRYSAIHIGYDKEKE